MLYCAQGTEALVTMRHKSCLAVLPAGFTVDKHCELEAAGAEAVSSYYNEHVSFVGRVAPRSHEFECCRRVAARETVSSAPVYLGT